MAAVYLPVEATIPGMTSAERATAINAEVWSLSRPDSVKSPNDITRYYYPQITHPETGEVAIVGDTTEQVKIHPAVDLTDLLALLPEVPQEEKDGLVMFIDANRGRVGSVWAVDSIHLHPAHRGRSRGFGLVPRPHRTLRHA